MQSAFFPHQKQQVQEDNASAAQQQGPTQADTTAANAWVLNGSLHKPGSLAARGMRFPSSRNYLWDRSPAGAQVLIDLQEARPHVQVAVSAFSAISLAAERTAGSAGLQCRLSVTSDNHVTALVQELDPLGDKSGDCLQLSCPLSPASSLQDALPGLRSAVLAQLDQRDTARMQQLYALTAVASAAASLTDGAELRLLLVMPSCALLATPLYAKRLCHVPVADALQKPGGMTAWQTGCLSMDQARSLLPLEATDVNVYSMPLVGVWVKGPSSPMHPLVAAACLRFVYSSLLADRAVNSDGAFLLLLCPEGDPVSKCFEVCAADSSKLHLASYELQAILKPGISLAQCPGGLLTATWELSRQQPHPLPGNFLQATAQTGPGRSAAAAAKSSSNELSQAAGHAAADSYGIGAGATTQNSIRHAIGTPNGAGMSAAEQWVPGCGFITGTPDVTGPRAGGFGKRVSAMQPMRSSAPSSTQFCGSSSPLQHCADTAVARRSLPIPESMAAAVFPAAQLRDSSAAEDMSWPQPRSSIPTVPYSRALMQSGQSLSGQQRAAAEAEWQQQKQEQQLILRQGTPVSYMQQQQQDLVQLGHQLLIEPGSGSPMQLARQSAASPAVGTSNIQQQQQQQQSRYSIPLLDQSRQALISTPGQSPAFGGSSSPGLTWSERQQQQLHSSLEAAAASVNSTQAGLAAAAAVVAGSPQQSSSEWRQQLQGDRPASPSVRASMALSNLTLLQHLSSGQLQQAAARVGQPSGPIHSASPVANAGKAQSRLAVTSTASDALEGVYTGSSAADSARAAAIMHGIGDNRLNRTPGGASAVSNTGLAAAGSHDGRSTRLQPPPALLPQQQPALQLLRFQLPVPGPPSRMQHQPLLLQQRAGVTSPADSDYAGDSNPAWLRTSMELPAGCASSSAAVALAAATAAVQRIPEHPYGRSLGIQRYAADAAELSSDVPLRTSMSSVTGAVGRQSPLPGAMLDAQQPWCSSVSVDEQGLLQQQQRPPAAAGGMLPSWQDPVAAALQGEVQKLRQELLQLQQQLRAAGMPRSQQVVPLGIDLGPMQQHAFAQTSEQQQPAAMQAQSAANADLQHSTTSNEAHGTGVQQQEQQSYAGPIINTQLSDCLPQQQPQHVTFTDNSEAAGLGRLHPHNDIAAVRAVYSLQHSAVAPQNQSSGQASHMTASIPVSCPAGRSSSNLGEAESTQAVASELPQHSGLQQSALQAVTSAAAGSQSYAGNVGGGISNNCKMAAASQNDVAAAPLPNHHLSCSEPDAQRGKLRVLAAGAVPQQQISSGAAAHYTSSSSAEESSSSNSVSRDNSHHADNTLDSQAASSSGRQQHGNQSADHSGTAAAAGSHSKVRQLLGGDNTRRSWDVAPMIEVVRARQYEAYSESDDSDGEFEEKLMLKYGLKQR